MGIVGWLIGLFGGKTSAVDELLEAGKKKHTIIEQEIKADKRVTMPEDKVQNTTLAEIMDKNDIKNPARLAKLIGVSPFTASKMVYHNHIPRNETVGVMMRYFDVNDVRELFPHASDELISRFGGKKRK